MHNAPVHGFTVSALTFKESKQQYLVFKLYVRILKQKRKQLIEKSLYLRIKKSKTLICIIKMSK